MAVWVGPREATAAVHGAAALVGREGDGAGQGAAAPGLRGGGKLPCRGGVGGTGEGRRCGLCSRRPRGLLLGLGFATGLDGLNVWLCINFGSFGLIENRTEPNLPENL